MIAIGECTCTDTSSYVFRQTHKHTHTAGFRRRRNQRIYLRRTTIATTVVVPLLLMSDNNNNNNSDDDDNNSWSNWSEDNLFTTVCPLCCWKPPARERDDHARDACTLIRQRGIDVRESVAASLNVIAHVDDTSFPSINYACVWTMRKEGLPCSSRPPTRQLANSPCSRKKVQNKLERKSKKKQNPNPTNPS